MGGDYDLICTTYYNTFAMLALGWVTTETYCTVCISIEVWGF
jgi:hypothetical protein